MAELKEPIDFDGPAVSTRVDTLQAGDVFDYAGGRWVVVATQQSSNQGQTEVQLVCIHYKDWIISHGHQRAFYAVQIWQAGGEIMVDKTLALCRPIVVSFSTMVG